ncbi:hypothetical protein PVAP13_4KG024590 [Panicum virgatum]|uniref:Uncharacterized protein n=1 Tax=Panicum virgatum TaxID=38727 RepID=A0A8T0TBU5_PANVG|nr:hypothetical protein PVAP13_4KG024590 [Panicum virgatum]
MPVAEDGKNLSLCGLLIHPRPSPRTPNRATSHMVTSSSIRITHVSGTLGRCDVGCADGPIEQAELSEKSPRS